MTNYRERPKCRAAIMHLMQTYNCDLKGVINHNFLNLSKGLRLQARKMIQEEKQQQLIDSIKYIEHKGVSYPLMLCEEYNGVWRFLCPFCMKYHSHGGVEGHRNSHCQNQIFKEHGYFLELEEKKYE